MTREQYERWKDFALRMVHIAISARSRAPSRAIVRENIEFFFQCRMEPDSEWERVRDWDHTEATEEQKLRWPRSAMCVASHISDLEEYFIPDYWGVVGSGSKYDRAWERWANPVVCCVRAGLDVAVVQSGGVVGYTAGEIRSMYPYGVPEWVTAFFAQPGEAVSLHATNIAGIYIPAPSPDLRTFDELPAEAGVWL